jgi:tetratricopeptide (TPR) repeat protein
MKKSLVILFSLAYFTAFSQTAKELQETARNFLKNGDYPNAILVIQKAIQQDNKSLDLQKDLAMAYYLSRDFANGKEVVKNMLDREDADVQCFQLAGNIYKALEETKECERVYKKGLKKFPNSGALYNELGELLWGKGNSEAIVQWEKGIENDPNYSGNYYNAARYYHLTTNKVWALVYGEMFVNMESYSPRTAEIKTLLLDAYKKFFTNDASFNKKESKANDNDFTRAIADILNKNATVISNGVTPETLVMLRTRFILDWYEKNAARYPSRLFDHQHQLLQEGMFDAYNQWLFGAADNLAQYEAWTKTHPEEYDQFTRLQRNKLFKVPAGQYYQKL